MEYYGETFDLDSPFAPLTRYEGASGDSSGDSIPSGERDRYVFAGEEEDGLAALEAESTSDRYKRKLLEGIGKLDPATGRRISFGVPTSPGQYYEKDWSVRDDEDLSRRAGGHYRMLVLKSGKSPVKAIKRIVDHPDRWSLDCAYFVQVAQLYALSQTSPTAFDRQYRARPFFLRYHGSTGIRPKYYFDKERLHDPWRAWFPKRPGARSTLNAINTARWTEDRIKAAMPIGSRLMWRNDLIAKGQSDFRNENAVKVGVDRYRAFGLGVRHHMSEGEIKTKMAQETMSRFPDPADPHLSVADYRARHVFLSEAQSFRGP